MRNLPNRRPLLIPSECPPYRLLIENSEANAYDEEGNETDSLGLTGFERAQLANLAVETVEEAKNLIPT